MTRGRPSAIKPNKADGKRETKPGRTRLMALGLVVLAIIALVLVRQAARPPEADSTLPAEIGAALASGQPAVFVLTYSGECCPGTEEFFAFYNETVAGITGEFEDDVAVVWVDISLMNVPAVATAVEDLARRFSVASFPSVLVLSSSGEVVDLLVGYPDTEAIRAAIARSVGGG